MYRRNYNMYFYCEMGWMLLRNEIGESTCFLHYVWRLTFSEDLFLVHAIMLLFGRRKADAKLFARKIKGAYMPRWKSH